MRSAEARSLYERALRIVSQKFGEDSALAADAYGALGRLEIETGQYEDACRNLGRAFPIHERMVGPQHPSLIVDLRSLAYLDIKTGKLPEARTYLERALSIAQSKLGAAHVTTLAITINLADVSARENKWPDALAMLRRAADQAGPDRRVFAYVGRRARGAFGAPAPPGAARGGPGAGPAGAVAGRAHKRGARRARLPPAN